MCAGVCRDCRWRDVYRLPDGNEADHSSLVVFDKADGKPYNVVPRSDKRYIKGAQFLSGNLIAWYDLPYSSGGCGNGTYKYVVLK
jgi:hypothetical protein